MKPLLPFAILLVAGIAGCGKSATPPDPYAKYRDIKLERGIPIANVKQQLGEPDNYEDWWNESPTVWSPLASRSSALGASTEQDASHPYHAQKLGYGCFGAHDQKKGHITKHRLTLVFVDGELACWERSTPVGRE